MGLVGGGGSADFIFMGARIFLINLWFVCGSPFAKKAEVTKMTETMKTTQAATNKELSAGLSRKAWK